MVPVGSFRDFDGDDCEPTIRLDAFRNSHSRRNGMETRRSAVGIHDLHQPSNFRAANRWLVHRSHGTAQVHNCGWSSVWCRMGSTLPGIGAAFVYSGCIGSALKWFPNRRGLASGVIAAGFGGGTALFIPIIKYLIDTHTYRSAFLVTGIIQGVTIAIVAQFLRYPGPEFAAKAAGPAIAKA